MTNDITPQFYFGPVTELTVDDDTESYFSDDGGKLYYYKIVMDPEQFYIYDTCNRMMPVDRGFVRSMNTAMFGVTQIYKADAAAAELFQRKYNEAMQLVDHFNQEDQQ